MKNIDQKVKSEAEAVFAELGMSLSGAIKLFLTKTAREKKLPFELTPNPELLLRLQEAEQGIGLKETTLEDLIKELEQE